MVLEIFKYNKIKFISIETIDLGGFRGNFNVFWVRCLATFCV